MGKDFQREKSGFYACLLPVSQGPSTRMRLFYIEMLSTVVFNPPLHYRYKH